MESLKNEMNILVQIVLGVSTDSEVIHVDDEPPFPNVVCEVKVHECLKYWGRSAEAKKHYGWFKQLPMG